MLKLFIVIYASGALYSASPFPYADNDACTLHATKWNQFFSSHENFKEAEVKCEWHENNPVPDWQENSPLRD